MWHTAITDEFVLLRHAETGCNILRCWQCTMVTSPLPPVRPLTEYAPCATVLVCSLPRKLQRHSQRVHCSQQLRSISREMALKAA